MALKTDVRRLVRIDDRMMRAARFVMAAPGTMTRFAPDIHRMGAFGLQLRVRGGFEITGNFRMTLGASLRADKIGSRYLRRDHRDAIYGNAGDNAGGRQCDNCQRGDDFLGAPAVRAS